MQVTLPDGTEEDDPFWGEVTLNRVKHYFYEAAYDYAMSVTADAVQLAIAKGWYERLGFEPCRWWDQRRAQAGCCKGRGYISRKSQQKGRAQRGAKS